MQVSKQHWTTKHQPRIHWENMSTFQKNVITFHLLYNLQRTALKACFIEDDEREIGSIALLILCTVTSLAVVIVSAPTSHTGDTISNIT